MKVLDYKVVEGDNLTDLEDEEWELVKKDYEPVGGRMVLTKPAPSYKQVYIQEMVKFEKEGE